MTDVSAAMAAAFEAACRDELAALKPGNVHAFADGHRMRAGDFVRSAAAAMGPMTQPGARVGARILGAVEATRAAVGMNTNLGIVLLCAPLAAAAEEQPADMRTALSRALASLDVEDARLTFRAITLAAPGGLGSAERHDVRKSATVSLRAAMAEAADRDRIAHQYVSDFEDVFVTGEAAHARARDPVEAAQAVFLAFLSAFPDSHILRKHGAATAEEVRRTAASFYARLQSAGPQGLIPDLLRWDRELKDRDINPGTSADLTVATLFVARLQNVLPSRGNNG
jgi:triphosphoribosyl-dephospho-CoA synthase